MREEAFGDEIDHGAQVFVRRVAVGRAVARCLARRNFRRAESKQKEVLRADFFANLDIRAVQRADGQCAVHLKLHVAGAGRFLACCRNLLRQICRRINMLAVGHAEIGNEHHLQQIPHGRVAVHHFGHRRDQANDELRHRVTRRRLAAEHEHPGRGREMRIGLQPQVKPDHVQDVEMLALVLMDALHLHIENRRGVNGETRSFADERREGGLVGQLDGAPVGAEAGVLRQRFQAA